MRPARAARSSAEQRTRFAIRQVDPVRQWKLSPMDLASLDKWDAYTAAKEEMFRATDTDHAPWVVVKSNDKKRARVNAMRHLLAKFDYDGKEPRDRRGARSADRRPRAPQRLTAGTGSY
jgi:polyphosphate kinase